ncbi:MAG: DUF499 domain-containing protein [Thermoflexaceae bacterium]|nr:DUF499 domain-containing protein [Thermoflexaceae bacterium]
MSDFSYHTALGEGVKLYTDAMRHFVREKLIARYPNNWFERGVLQHLQETQRKLLKQELDKKALSPADYLHLMEPVHFRQVIGKEFDHAFAGVWTDFKQTQAYLNQAVTARNEWAHPRTGDMLADDAAEGLRAMHKLLERTGRAEAAQVEALWKKVNGVADDAPAKPLVVPEAQPAPSPAPAGQLPYWWQLTEPWEGFQNPAKIDESLFAASLGGVAAGTARDEYLNPVRFFEHTYFTEQLRQTVNDVISRMHGGDGASVTEMQTPFGGGKTHALLTLYHLVKSPDKAMSVPGVKEALGEVVVPAGARIAVVDGSEMGTDALLKEDGTSVSTLWGEIAYQLDPKAYRQHVQPSDDRGEKPGNAAYREVLKVASPCLILIDELISYLVGLKFSNARRTQNLYRQTVQFLQEFLQEAGNIPGVCVLLTLPQSRQEFGGIDPGQLQQELGIVEEIKPRADRVVSKRMPVADTEVYTLISRRLFKPADPAAVNRTVDAYYESYNKGREQALYDPTVYTTDFRRQMVDAFPFHPELIDVLYKKWGAQADFPRTRTVLQLLANVVADQWQIKPPAHAIHSKHVNLERERIRTKVLSAMGSAANDSVVAADIIGGDAHADALDERRGGDYQHHKVARGVATTVLLHSAGGRSGQNGAMPSDIRLGSVSPLLGPEYTDEVLGSIEETCYYIHREGQMLRFQTKQNLYRRIAETANNQPQHVIDDRIRTAIADAYGSSQGFKVLQWAGADGSITDQPEPSIAILAATTKLRVQDDTGQPSASDRKIIEELWNRVGGGFRQWRNALVLIGADRDLWERAEQALREVLAYELILDQKSKDADTLSPQERKDLDARLREKRASLKTSLVTAYRWLFYPDGDGELPAIALPTATAGDTIAKRAIERLESHDYGNPKVLRHMSAMFFDAKFSPRVWDKDTELDIAELSRRFPQWTYLPILPDRDQTLRSCIREGIKDGLWSVVYGDKSTTTYRRLIEKPVDLDALPELFDSASFLVRGDLRELIRQELGSAEPSPIPSAGEPGAVISTTTTTGSGSSHAGGTPSPAPVPAVAKRYARVRLTVSELPVVKSQNLQPYLWKALQEADPGTRLSLSIDVSSDAGIPEDVLERRIREGFEQLGINVDWEVS